MFLDPRGESLGSLVLDIVGKNASTRLAGARIMRPILIVRLAAQRAALKPLMEVASEANPADVGAEIRGRRSATC